MHIATSHRFQEHYLNASTLGSKEESFSLEHIYILLIEFSLSDKHLKNSKSSTYCLVEYYLTKHAMIWHGVTEHLNAIRRWVRG